MKISVVNPNEGRKMSRPTFFYHDSSNAALLRLQDCTMKKKQSNKKICDCNFVFLVIFNPLLLCNSCHIDGISLKMSYR